MVATTSWQTCSGQQEKDDRQDVEGLPAVDSHLLVLMCENGRECEDGREGGSASAGRGHPLFVDSSSHMAAATAASATAATGGGQGS